MQGFTQFEKGTASYTGVFVTDDGLRFEFIKKAPRPVGNTTEERGLREIYINGVLRAFVKFPHGWGGRPTIHKLSTEPHRLFEPNSILTLSGKKYLQDSSIVTAMHNLKTLLENNRLISHEDADKQSKIQEQEIKAVNDARKKLKETEIAAGINNIDKLFELLRVLEKNLLQQDKDLLISLIERASQTYPQEVADYYKHITAK